MKKYEVQVASKGRFGRAKNQRTEIQTSTISDARSKGYAKLFGPKARIKKGQLVLTRSSKTGFGEIIRGTATGSSSRVKRGKV